MDYSLAQFHAYQALAAERWRNEARWQLMAASAAQAGGEPLKNLFKALK
jgi:hypothetical protein